MFSSTANKIITLPELLKIRPELKASKKTVVFTNGCFDIMHLGHVQYLEFARQQGDLLIIGMNSDASVQRAKGPTRPINPENDRGQMLAALECVDYVVLYEEDEPRALIGKLLPDVLVKGEDWAHYVSGREEVEAAGGKVVLAKLVKGRSTTAIIERIISTHNS